MHRLRPCDVRWRRFLFVTVIVGKVMGMLG